jgi:hypothetical protein
MQEFLIRFATIDDAELIADLSRRTFHETFGYVNTRENMDKFMNEQFTRETLINEVTEPGNTFLLAFDEDTPVGYARMREGKKFPEFENKDSIEIARIYSVNSYLGHRRWSATDASMCFYRKRIEERNYLAGCMGEKSPGYCFLHKVGV